MCFRIIVIVFVVLLSPLAVCGQQRDSTTLKVQEDLDRVFGNIDPEEMEQESEQLRQYLQELAAHPRNINHADLNDLRRVPGLNLRLAKAILTYRQEEKPFEDPEELLKVTGIGRVTFKKIAPYITIGDGLKLSKTLYTDHRYWTDNSHFQMFSRYQRDLQEKRGYLLSPEERGYLGSPIKYYQRVQYRSNHLSVNITQEKDAGELLPGPNQFDHQSWHLALKDNGRLQMLTVGDYSLSFGQGLVLSSGSFFGKGSDVIGAANRSGRGIKAYTSAQEANFQRGAAFTYGRKLQLTGFYSSRKRTATEISQDTVRMPRADGYHRTKREYSRRLNTGQKLYGGHLQLTLPFGVIGATGYRVRFDRYITATDQPYARYDFTGKSTSVFGTDYTLLLGPAILFGEAARSENGGWGLVAGLESSIGSSTQLTAAYRNYQKNFQSIFGYGFGEQSGSPKNEECIYLGLQQAIGERFTVSAYMDQFNFPSARFGTHQPTKGNDWLIRIKGAFSSKLKAYLQFRNRVKESEYKVVTEQGRSERRLGEEQRGGIRGNIEFWVNEKIRLRTSAEWIRSNKAGEDMESGYLLYQDMRLLLGENLKIDARITVFDTESYTSRAYQFENDLLYVFSSKVLFDRGERMYILLNYEPFPF